MSEVKGLLVMDVDSTLVQEEVIDLLGEEAGVGQRVYLTRSTPVFISTREPRNL